MGIIKKQAIQGTIVSYAGVAIGFVTASVLQPFLLTVTQIGLLRILNSYSTILSQIFTLGFDQVAIRLFPQFKDEEKQHNGFLFLGLLTLFIGFGGSVLVYHLGYDFIVQSGSEDSPLFLSYTYLILPLVFFQILFRIFDAYIRMLYQAVIGSFFKEFLQRIFILITLILLALQWVDFNYFVLLYAVALSLPGMLIVFYPLYARSFFPQPRMSFLHQGLRKEIIKLSGYGILAAAGAVLVFEVDSLMVYHLIGEAATGIYATMFYFGLLISVPSRALKRISSAMLSQAWDSQQVESIEEIYRESSINQFIIGAWVFLGIWLNIDYVLAVLPSAFAEGKYVVLFIGLGNLFDMLTGVNAEIISSSPRYRYNTYFTLLLLLLLIPLNLLFIRFLDMGLTGAAQASCLAMLLVNMARFVYLKKQYGWQPFTKKTFQLAIIFIVIWFLGSLFQGPENPYIGVAVKSLVISLLFVAAVYKLEISPKVNAMLSRFIRP